VSADLQQIVAQSADAADMHANVPTLLLELQMLLGSLTASATASTERGRRPFRPGPDWAGRLGELAFGVYLLADQSGIDVAQSVVTTAGRLGQASRTQQAAGNEGWPFDSH
jgi:hypothetical protein